MTHNIISGLAGFFMPFLFVAWVVGAGYGLYGWYGKLQDTFNQPLYWAGFWGCLVLCVVIAFALGIYNAFFDK